MFELSTSQLRLLLLLVILFLPLWPPYILIKIGKLPALDLPRLIIFVLVMLWLIFAVDTQIIRRRLLVFYKESKSIITFLLLLFLWEMLSAIVNSSGVAIMASIRDIIFFFFIFLVTISILDNHKNVDSILLTIMLATLFVSIIGVIENIVQHNLFAHLATTELGDSLKTDTNLREGARRVAATFIHSLALANWICIALPSLFYIFTEPFEKIWKIIAAITLFLAVITLYSAHSRVGLLVCSFEAFIVIAISMDSFIGRIRPLELMLVLKIIRIIIFTLSALFLLYLSFSLLLGSTASESMSTAARGAQYIFAIPLILSKPFFGYGQTEAQKVLGLSNSIDNYFLSLILESGLPALVFFIIILFLVIIEGINLYKANWCLSKMSGVITLTIASNILFLLVSSLEDGLPIIFIYIGIIYSLKSFYKSSLYLA